MVVHRGHVVHKTVGDHSELDCLSTSTHSYCPYKGRHRIIIIIVAGFPRASSRWRCAHAETQLLLIRENENGATNSIETPTRSNSDDQMGMDEQFVTGRPSDEPSGARARCTGASERSLTTRSIR